MMEMIRSPKMQLIGIYRAAGQAGQLDIETAVAFSGQPNALNSGWGATFNYDNLSSGPHTVGVQIEDSTEAAVSLVNNVTVVQLGIFALVDQFYLSETTARLEGEIIVLSGVVVRDKASQQSKTMVALGIYRADLTLYPLFAWEVMPALEEISPQPLQAATSMGKCCLQAIWI